MISTRFVFTTSFVALMAFAGSALVESTGNLLDSHLNQLDRVQQVEK